MKTKLIKHAALLVLLSTLIFQPSTALAQGTIFTYQGSLNDSGSPANGTNYGMVFYLYDAPAAGNVLGNLGIVSVSVSNGLFTVPLDFGTNFPGADRWLEITVQKNGGGFTTLAPRQKLTPTPYAITAGNLSGSLPATQLTGTIPAASIAGPYSSAVTLNNPANSFTGTFTGNGAGLTNLPTSGTAWQLTGNTGTTAGPNFLGTTDNQPLELHVGGLRALRLEPTVNDANHSNIVNVLGGSPANFVAPGTYGATISGGGAATYHGLTMTNSVAADFGSIGGGIGNAIQNNSIRSTIGGGQFNTIQANAAASIIGGGYSNTIQTNAIGSFIGGGQNNTIRTNASGSTIGGGQLNAIWAYASSSTIGGGAGNTIQGTNDFQSALSTIGGGGNNTIQTSAENSVIGGGSYNTIKSGAGTSTIGGGNYNTIQGGAAGSAIGGGIRNTIQANGGWSTINGGISNLTTGSYATVPGGDQNVAGTNSFAAGHRAKATNTGTFVWADSTDVDFASTADNQFLIRASGGVGIGANNPDAALTVNGDADKPGGGSWSVFSDARLKKNIEPLTGALNRLMELRAVTFEYKDPQSIHELPGVQIGMIAQEVEKIFPDWVDTAPNGMKRLSIHGFEALTVESLRELRAEKDAKISALEKSNAEMQQRLAVLEKTVARLAAQSSVPLAATEQAEK